MGDEIDHELINEILELLQTKTETMGDGILVLLACLHVISMWQNISKEEAIEEYRQVFLDLKVVERDLH